MSAVLTCQCGRTFLAADDTSECPECRAGADASFDDLADSAWVSNPPKSSLKRMFEALLDPQAIRWLLVLGGTLSVIGIVVWMNTLPAVRKRNTAA